MASKKVAPLEPTEVPENVDTKEAGLPVYIDMVRFQVKDLPLTSQINTLLDEVERLSKIQ